jgi:hypothetical protein
MAREPKYGVTFNGWERLAARLEANAAELAHLEVPRLKLLAMLTEVRAVAAQQATLSAARQEATRRLQTLITDGRKLATFLRTGVREHYGSHAEKLVEFDLRRSGAGPARSSRRPRRRSPRRPRRPTTSRSASYLGGRGVAVTPPLFSRTLKELADSIAVVCCDDGRDPFFLQRERQGLSFPEAQPKILHEPGDDAWLRWSPGPDESGLDILEHRVSRFPLHSPPCSSSATALKARTPSTIPRPRSAAFSFPIPS